MGFCKFIRRCLAKLGLGITDTNDDDIKSPADGAQLQPNVNITATGTAKPSTTNVDLAFWPVGGLPSAIPVTFNQGTQGTGSAAWTSSPFQLPTDNTNYVLRATFSHSPPGQTLVDHNLHTGNPPCTDV